MPSSSPPSEGFQRIRAHVGILSAVGWMGLTLTITTVGVGVFGPYFAPHGPTEILGPPYGGPIDGHLLGFDYLGRDALSRYLWGGRTALLIAALGTLLGTVVGVSAGIFSAYMRGLVDAVFGRATEVLLAFPALILMILLINAFGTNLSLVVIGIGFITAPATARIVRGAAIEIRDLAYVEVAHVRGERRLYIMMHEMLPNILGPIAVDLGLRFPVAIVIVAGLGFLGLGVQPPAADWGLMISENREGMGIQPWAVVPAIVTIALLTVGINLVFDNVRRRRRLPERVER